MRESKLRNIMSFVSTKGYSDDLRWRIVWMKNVHGMTTEDACSTMLVSERTVQRICR